MNGPWLPLLLLAYSTYTLRGACAPGFGAPRGVARQVSSLPDRPVGVGPDRFHGSQFRSFDDTAFATGSPAVEAAPAFLFSRTGSSDVSTAFASKHVALALPVILRPFRRHWLE